eukprot:2659533-Amphidinium_carterae.1
MCLKRVRTIQEGLSLNTSPENECLIETHLFCRNKIKLYCHKPVSGPRGGDLDLDFHAWRSRSRPLGLDLDPLV